MNCKKAMIGSAATTEGPFFAAILAVVVACRQPSIELHAPEAAHSMHRARFRDHEFTLTRRAQRLITDLERTGSLAIDTHALFEWGAVRALKTPSGECAALNVTRDQAAHYQFNIQLRANVLRGSIVFDDRWPASSLVAVQIPALRWHAMWDEHNTETCTKFFVASDVTNETVSLVEVGQTVGCSSRPFPLSLATIYRSMRACQNPGSAPNFDELQNAGADPIPPEWLARRPLWPRAGVDAASTDASVPNSTE